MLVSCTLRAKFSLRVLKHLKCLHELCVTATPVAPTADYVGEPAKSAGQTVKTQLLPLGGHTSQFEKLYNYTNTAL